MRKENRFNQERSDDEDGAIRKNVSMRRSTTITKDQLDRSLVVLCQRCLSVGAWTVDAGPNGDYRIWNSIRNSLLTLG